MRRFSHTIGFDDGAFARSHRGDVVVVGAVFALDRLDGVVATRVRRDGRNATVRLVAAIRRSRFAPQLDLVLLQGIALAGFNVVDVEALARLTGLPVLVVARRRPDLQRIRAALCGRVRGGERKWRLIEKLEPMAPVQGVFAQRHGLTAEEARRVIERLQIHGREPEPLRVAHLVAGALTRGESRGRA
ncbi:MAG: DUF99 family protein [Acidobacteriota bacterium]